MPQSRTRVPWISIVSPSITLACQVGSERRTNFRQQRGDQRYASDGIASEAVLHSTNTSRIAPAIKPNWAH